MTEENTTNNQAATDTGAVEVEASETVQAAQAGSDEGASAQAGTVNQPPTEGKPAGTTDFDVRKSYEELRKEFTRRTQHEKQLMSEIASIKEAHSKQAELLAKAMEEPFDPNAFMESWKTQGPKALDPYYQKREEALKSHYDKQLQDIQTQALNDRVQLNLALRRGDAETYPNFKELEPFMAEIANDEGCPVDLTKPIGEVLDALYKLAREQHSVEAIKQAEKLGADQKEKELAKEASTAVAGGGKRSGAIHTDPKNMTSDQLKKIFQEKGMVDDGQ